MINLSVFTLNIDLLTIYMICRYNTNTIITKQLLVYTFISRKIKTNYVGMEINYVCSTLPLNSLSPKFLTDGPRGGPLMVTEGSPRKDLFSKDTKMFFTITQNYLVTWNQFFCGGS